MIAGQHRTFVFPLDSGATASHYPAEFNYLQIDADKFTGK